MEEDWNKRWQDARLNYTLGQQRVSSPSFWDDRWKGYETADGNSDARLKKIISKLGVNPSDMILDIGSGPGALAIPLAQSVQQVTAIDISEVALAHLEARAGKEGLSNVACINKRWEDIKLGIDIKQYDIIVASYMLTMLDLTAALDKMNRAAKRAVYIFDTAGKKYHHFQELWPRLRGEKFIVSPDYIYVVNVLYQMGIYANVDISEYEQVQKYPTLDEAVQQLGESLGATTLEDSGIIRGYLRENLVKEEDVVYLKSSQKMAAIWWSKE
jgi:ubiquinone/menaquinone biosynthesis C-methylase UbiE